jgi:hypothetical protein
MEEQRASNNAYDPSAANSLLAEMDKTIDGIDTSIDVELEAMDETITEGNNGLSDDDVDLIDEL